MARGRMVNCTVATDKRLATLSIEAEYLYLKTIPHLDRDGLLLGDASLLWALVAPRRPELLDDTKSYIEEWIHAKLVIAYDTPDGLALYYPGFAKNQIGMRYDREPESTIQAPPGYVRTASGLVPDNSRDVSGNPPADFRQSSGSYPAEVKLKEEKVEVKGMERKAPAAPTTTTTTIDNDVLRCAQNAQHVLGVMPSDVNVIVTRLKAHGHVEWFDLALTAAEDAGANKKNWAYVKTILTTCMAEDRPPGAHKKPGGNGSGRRGSEARRLDDAEYLQARYGKETRGHLIAGADRQEEVRGGQAAN
jgi:hypothetical protein